MTKEEYTLNSLFSALQEMKSARDKLICLPELKEKADALIEEFQKEYESAYKQFTETSFEEAFDLSEIIASDRLSAFQVAKHMLIHKGFLTGNKYEQYAARALGASLEYLSKKNSLSADSLRELWKAPEQFLAEIKDNPEMSYGLTGIYLCFENGQTEIVDEITNIINRVLI